MTNILDLSKMTPEKRYEYFISQIKNQQEIWILQDNDGCVMLITEDEDCIPVWHSKDIAKVWASDEWQHCQPLAISLKTWNSRWTSGMKEDDLMLAICPLPDDDGLVISPDELASKLDPKGKYR